MRLWRWDQIGDPPDLIECDLVAGAVTQAQRSQDVSAPPGSAGTAELLNLPARQNRGSDLGLHSIFSSPWQNGPARRVSPMSFGRKQCWSLYFAETSVCW